MTKNEFIRQLKMGLMWQIPREELKEIISEYERFFAEKSAENSEEELVAQCGDVKLIIDETLSDKELATKPLLRLSIAILLTVALWVVNTFFTGEYFNPLTGLIPKLLTTLAFPTIIFFVLGGKKLFSNRIIKSRTLIGVYVANIVLIITCVIVYYVSVHTPAMSAINNGEEYIKFAFATKETAGNYIWIAIELITLILIVICAVIFVFTMKSNIMAFPLIFLNFSALGASFALVKLLKHMGGIEIYPSAIVYIQQYFYIGIVAMILSFAVLHICKKR